MRIGAFSFAPRPATTLAAAAVFALLAALGCWQLNRAQERLQQQALLEARSAETALRLTGSVDSPEPLAYRRVTAAGEWLADRQIYIDNRILEGRAGFHVITPLRLEGRNDVVLVNRGWIARTASYPEPPRVEVPPGRADVGGLAVVPSTRFLELSPETVAGSVWQNLSIDRFRQRTGMPALPIVILASPPAPGLIAVRERPDARVARHHEYALTWFALAATVLVLWIVLNFRRPE